MKINFRSAAFKDQSGASFRLVRVEGEKSQSARRQVSLRLVASRKGTTGTQTVATVELSRREAYALSEWIDELVTHLPPESKA